ncbi:hypothetical protein BKA70DRAFT_1332013 [Coprinopsis sp. MPI-PUGE-AT-0042]|nr:hypothetical protein BKA70DRAFT_1332013 [Coprinopsis sp. MPI-PUGE-AT-0042]
MGWISPYRRANGWLLMALLGRISFARARVSLCGTYLPSQLSTRLKMTIRHHRERFAPIEHNMNLRTTPHPILSLKDTSARTPPRPQGTALSIPFKEQ